MKNSSIPTLEKSRLSTRGMVAVLILCLGVVTLVQINAPNLLNGTIWYLTVSLNHVLRHPVPLIPLALVLTFLRGAGRSFGVYWLFWHEQSRKQFIVGVSAGILGLVSCVVSWSFQADQWYFDSRVVDLWTSLWDCYTPAFLKSRPFLFGFTRLSFELLLYALPILLLLLMLTILLAPKNRLRSSENEEDRSPTSNVALRGRIVRRLPMLLGVISGIFITLLTVEFIGSRIGLVDAAADPRFDSVGPWTTQIRGSLVIAELAIAATLIVSFGIIANLSDWFRAFLLHHLSPAASSCMLLTAMVLIYGGGLAGLDLLYGDLTTVLQVGSDRPFLSSRPDGLWGLLIGLLVVVLVTLAGRGRYTIRIMELERLGYYRSRCKSSCAPGNRQSEGCQSAGFVPLPLINNQQGSIELIPDTLHSVDGEQPLLVVATSGGGIAAAAWTVGVLNRLEADLGKFHFPQNVALITGASGGMIGAAHYVATLKRPTPSLPVAHTVTSELMYDQICRDILSATLHHFAFRDLPLQALGFRPGRDRGQVLEDSLIETLGPEFGQPLMDLADGEREGWRPSLVFSPTLIEDGRRLLISNRDLSGVYPAQYGPVLPFFHAFPMARRSLRIATAARMSAAFPLISPAPVLPTVPRRRVGDAGYYDNYGVDLAVAWLYKHAAELGNTRKVALIEIRAFGLNQGALGKFEEQSNRSSRGLEMLTTPISGLLSTRQSVMAFRNAQAFDRIRFALGPDRCRSFVFEPRCEAPLSWYISSEHRQNLLDDTRRLTSTVLDLKSFLS